MLLSFAISWVRFDSFSLMPPNKSMEGKLTQSFVWLRQSSSLRQFPLISDVRRRREIIPSDSVNLFENQAIAIEVYSSFHRRLSVSVGLFGTCW